MVGGGALVNTNGDLIGINTAITSQTGSYVGYSFAVPSNIAKKVVDDLLEFGNVQKGILGISAANTSSREAKELGLDEIEGVYVAAVEAGSGADDAGLLEGDIIKQIDNISVRKFSELTGYRSSKRPGNQVEVGSERDGKRLVFPVVLRKIQSLDVPNMNLRVKNLTKEDQKDFGVDEGVKIIAVPEIYRSYGMVGKVIVAVDGKEIENIDDANEVFSKISRYDTTSITTIDKNGEKERLIFQ